MVLTTGTNTPPRATASYQYQKCGFYIKSPEEAGLNPIAIWEIKEYYYTTTFGSRIADGVYETPLDGMELEELRVNEAITLNIISW